MNIVGRVSTLLFISLATGCAINHPQSASEFRQGVPGAFLAKVEKYEISQPFEQVASRFEKMAPRCLDKTIRTTSQTTTSYQVIVTDYNPTVIVHKDRAELHIQQDHLQGVMNVSEVPAGGYYLMVFDAIKVNAKTTRIEYYGPSIGFEPMIKAVKGWASGDIVGCPDMTKLASG